VGSIKPEDVADIAQHPEVIAEMRDGQLMTTTKTVLRDEVAMLQFAKDGQRKFSPFVRRSTITARCRAFGGAKESRAACAEEPRYGDRRRGQGGHRQDADDARHGGRD
jgi:hypothetical protein